MKEDFGPNAWLVNELYANYSKDASLVDDEWRRFFSTYSNGDKSVDEATVSLALRVADLIDSYRAFGHTKAQINPLTSVKMSPPSTALNFTFDDYQTRLKVFGGKSIKEIIDELETYYCGTTGYELPEDPIERRFFLEKIERPNKPLTKEERVYFLKNASDAQVLESELHKKYIGQKRFSIEGGESFLSVLGAIFEAAPSSKVSEVVIGMAHRGRLATLCNFIGKPLAKLFSEFEDTTWYANNGFGDVKYHNGGETIYRTRNNEELKARLIPNPSHLETVHAIVEGVVRALQRGGERNSVLPIVVHGDAAFIGQGIVFECLNFSAVDGYRTGGTIHIAINNQVGFTTSPEEARSSRYCSDGAKMLGAPVIHVNGEDVDACARAALLALEYRQKFEKDVVLDILCYRKYGHNEGDDPTFTQPLMYQEIKDKKTIPQIYAEKLTKEGVISEGEFQAIIDSYKERFNNPGSYDPKPIDIQGDFDNVKTAVSESRLKEVHDKLLEYPDGFNPHPKLKLILEKRTKAIFEDKGIEWGVGEALAFGTLIQDGVSVRLSGEDCGRGTFSHRHLALDDYGEKTLFHPLNELQGGGRFKVFNSTLSEYAVMGFEWGYSYIAKDVLTLWEGQFGDFANGAQIIIDQYLASAERKWGMHTNLVLLLPHGFEGQGPEHSSARLERFLQLCALENMTVAYPSNAAQYFHLLRRQALRKVRKPLVVMTPKSLLRHPGAMSKLQDFTEKEFSKVLVDDFGGKKKSVLCTGKIYYDLVSALKPSDFNLLRIEELYPFPKAELKGLLGNEVFWVQEEPKNQGAYPYILQRFVEDFGIIPKYIGRPESSQTACGSNKRHLEEQKAIIDELVKEI